MGHRVMPHELVSIVRRLDIDGDQKIEYEEFVESISPVSPEIERVVRPQNVKEPKILDEPEIRESVNVKSRKEAKPIVHHRNESFGMI
jgi:hypothetical protein